MATVLFSFEIQRKDYIDYIRLEEYTDSNGALFWLIRNSFTERKTGIENVTPYDDLEMAQRNYKTIVQYYLKTEV
jgi:hypothetical protein